MEILKMILIATIGTAGFSVIFRIKAAHIPFAALGGTLTCAVYLLLDSFGVDLFISNLVAALTSVIYSNTMARCLKFPATIFITAGIVPLVPGGALFYTMNCLILKDLNGFLSYGQTTLVTALGIAGGIAVESSIVSIFSKAFPNREK